MYMVTSSGTLPKTTFINTRVEVGLKEVRIPNKETRKVIADLEAGKGETFTGSSKDFLDYLLKTSNKRGS